MDGTNDPVTDESSADDSEQTTVTDGADEPVPDEVDADHTRDLEGDAADTTPIDEIELDVDEPVSPDEVESAGPGAGTENRSTGGSEAATDDESGGIFGWLRSLLFGG